MKEAQQVVAEKTGTLEAEAYKTRRLYEELAQLKRRVERLKKIEAAGRHTQGQFRKKKKKKRKIPTLSF